MNAWLADPDLLAAQALYDATEARAELRWQRAQATRARAKRRARQSRQLRTTTRIPNALELA